MRDAIDVRLFGLSLSLIVALVAACTPQSAIVLEIGSPSNPGDAREAFEKVEVALIDSGLTRRTLSKDISKDGIYVDDPRFLGAYFDDPTSPAAAPDAWFVQLLLTKDRNSVHVIFVQPGSTHPSELLKVRVDKMLGHLRELLTGVSVVSVDPRPRVESR